MRFRALDREAISQAPRDIKIRFARAGRYHMRHLRYFALLAICMFAGNYSRAQDADAYDALTQAAMEAEYWATLKA